MSDKLSIREVAKRLDKSVGTVYNWIHKEDLPASKLGRKYQVDSEELEGWVKTKQKEFNK